ncbi:hypothetical protein [Tsukamurella sp. PLM1]|uniref:hypothetical protein n=1 Tax=Tsukamurella sp. PLM1 TaxID=2929795 RepID=UPI0020C0943E|nr:hypothetical protein [Tsukamurella sp. PLM1]
MRSLTAFLLVLVAILATFVAVPANWASRTVLDRDEFTALMEPLGHDRGVQDAMAQEIAQQVQRLLTEQGDARPRSRRSRRTSRPTPTARSSPGRSRRPSARCTIGSCSARPRSNGCAARPPRRSTSHP